MEIAYAMREAREDVCNKMKLNVTLAIFILTEECGKNRDMGMAIAEEHKHTE